MRSILGRRISVTQVTFVVLVLAGLWVFWIHREGLANVRVCGSTEPGGSRSALVLTLGSPTTRQVNPTATRLTLFFRGPLYAAHPIRAVVNVRDDRVVEIDCGDGRVKIYDKY
jgi:hypothetical protein